MKANGTNPHDAGGYLVQTVRSVEKNFSSTWERRQLGRLGRKNLHWDVGFAVVAGAELFSSRTKLEMKALWGVFFKKL